jgi:hypothetical protein
MEPTVRFLDSDRRRVEIDGVEYIRSWKKPPKKPVSRQSYMSAYRSQRRQEIELYRTLLAKLSANEEIK